MRDIDVSRRQLLHTASAILAVKPRATLEEIARAANLSRPTLYRAFSSRDELLKAAALDALAAVEAGLHGLPLKQGEPVTVIEQLAQVLVPLGAKFCFLVSEDWLEQERRIASRLSKVEKSIAGVFQRARAAGALTTAFPIEWQVQAFVALVYAGWESIRAQILVPRDAVHAVISTFLTGERVPSSSGKMRKKQ